MASVQYTVRGIDPEVDVRLRASAQASGRSLNAVLAEALERAVGGDLAAVDVVHDDLDWFIGSGRRADLDAHADAEAWLASLPDDLA